MTSNILYPEMGSCTSSYRQDNSVMNSNFFRCMRADSTNNKDINIVDGKIRNPFFVDVTDESFDMTSLNKSNRILVICPTDKYDNTDTSLMVDKYIKEEYLKDCSDSYTIKLVDTPGKLELVKHHITSTLSVIGERLQTFNHANIDLQKIETVVCIFDLKESDLKLYLTIFQSEHNVEDIVKLSVMMERFNSSKYNNSIMNNRLSQIVTCVSDTVYWENPEKFKEVKFVLNPDITKELVTELFMTKTVCSNERILYDYFNTFLMSKEYCHLVLNNKIILKMMAPLITKFKPIYKLLMGYAWLGMFIEETEKGIDLTINDRVVFDIDTARHLPVFPFSSFDVHMNPYNTIQQPLSSIAKNYLGLEMISSVSGDVSSRLIDTNYGVSEFSIFKSRFNLITTGKINRSILDGYPVDEQDDNCIKTEAPNTNRSKWKDIVVVGSMVVKCSKKKDMRSYMVQNQEGLSHTDKYSRFIKEYDIGIPLDIMCTHISVFDYIDTVTKIKEIVKHNLLLINTETQDDPDNELNCVCNKYVTIQVTTDYIKHCMPEFSVEDVRNNFKESTTKASEISEQFFWRYNEEKRKKSTSMKKKRDKNNTYNDYFKPVNFENMKITVLEENDTLERLKTNNEGDFYIFLNDVLSKKEKVPQKDNCIVMIIREVISYYIYSSMEYTINIRNTTSTNTFEESYNYLLSCDGGIYDGNNVYFRPSTITTMMTNLNIDCKSCKCESNDCNLRINIEAGIESGYGTIQTPEQLQKHNLPTENSGGLSLTNVMFNPKSVDQHQPNNPKPRITYISNKLAFYDIYNQLYKYNLQEDDFDILKLKTINKEGQIEPFKKWWLDAAYDYLSK